MMQKRLTQRGIALPVILIMLTVMMVSGIYLLKSSTSSALTTVNLAYDSALAKAADAGLHAGFAYLRTVANKADLDNNQPDHGYVATLNSSWTVSTPAFWDGSLTLPPNAAGDRVEYVIHRLCTFSGPFNSGSGSGSSGNNCLKTSARPNAPTPVAFGSSLALGGAKYATQPQLHYVVTARIIGARGGNVITQAVILKGP